MSYDILLERLFQALISGDRDESRRVVNEALATLPGAEDVVRVLFWPVYETVEKLHREDQLSRLAHHCATRLLRVLVDQNAARLEREPAIGRSVLAFCGPKDADELGGQMAVDLLEAAGFRVTFGGGGIPGDEIMSRVHQQKPDVLLLFASGPSDLPQVRAMIDQLHEIGACPSLQIVVGGGVFNRAEGLAEEIGADLWADDPLELVGVLTADTGRRAAADQRTVGRTRRRKAA